MLEPTNGERADDPLGRFRDLNAKHAKDTWTPATEPIETAMEGGFRDGIKFAARRQASRPRPAKSLTETGRSPSQRGRAAGYGRGDRTFDQTAREISPF